MFKNRKTMSLFHNYTEYTLQKQEAFDSPVYASTGPTNPKLHVVSKDNLNITIYLLCATEKICEPGSVRC